MAPLFSGLVMMISSLEGNSLSVGASLEIDFCVGLD